MRFIRSFANFWYDFIVGDDWTAAAGVLLALIISILLVHGGLDPWWLIPLAVALSLMVSLWRATRRI
jgi:hypothetical protein